MEIAKLSERAMEIRSRFGEFEQARFRREWTKEEVMQGFVVDVGDLVKARDGEKRNPSRERGGEETGS